MKKSSLYCIAILLISVLFTNCSPNSQDYRSTTKEIISQGKWSVDYYYGGQDQTALYANAQFAFNASGHLTCQQDSTSYEGTWATITDVNRNEVLIIQVNGQNPKLMQLSQQWNVSGLGLKMVDLKDASNKEWRIKQL